MTEFDAELAALLALDALESAELADLELRAGTFRADLASASASATAALDENVAADPPGDLRTAVLDASVTAVLR